MHIEEEASSLIPKLTILSRSKQKQVMNSRVVMLIKDKLLPLNRGRYEHLQKINRTIHKQQYSYLSASMQTLPAYQNPDRVQTKKKGLTSREVATDVAAELLLNRLKTMKKINDSPTNVTHTEPSYKCWPTLQKDIQESSMSSTWRVDSSEKTFRSKRKQPLFDLVLKAQKHLRLRKHELKERYREKDEGRRSNGHKTELEAYISKLGGGRVRASPEEQLQKELLRDIRSNMLQEKMNKLKRDINHKKIVQMR